MGLPNGHCLVCRCSTCGINNFMQIQPVWEVYCERQCWRNSYYLEGPWSKNITFFCVFCNILSGDSSRYFFEICCSQKYWPKANVDPLNVPAIENVKKLSKYDRRPEDIKNLSRKTLQIFECPSISPNDAPKTNDSKNSSNVKRKWLKHKRLCCKKI